jgi:hypothetical protein
MPSLHVGWALWCGVILWQYGRTPAARTAAVVYPLLTTIVVMGTANHYFLDAVAGAAVMGAGLLLTPCVIRCADRVKARFLPVRTVNSRSTGPSTARAGVQASVEERLPRQRRDDSRDFIDV